MHITNQKSGHSLRPRLIFFLIDDSKWLARRHTGVLDDRLVRRHTGVQVYSGIYLEHQYAVPAARTRYLIS